MPPERSRSVVTLVTRNITMKGNIASSAGPSRSNVSPGRSSNIHHSRLISRQGSTSMIARVRWSRRSWVSTRAAMANVIRGFMRFTPHDREECLLDVGGGGEAGLLLDLGRRAVGDEDAVAHQQQPVAALGLVHDVARDEYGDARVGEVVEGRPQVLPEHRVEPDRGLVEHEQARVAEQRDRQAGARALPTAEVGHHVVGVVDEIDGFDAAAGLGAVDTEHAREEGEVLGDAEVVVHAGCLGHVADPGPQRLRAGGLAEHRRRAADAGLDTDEGPHQRRLAAAGRAEQAGDLADRDREVQAAQHLAPAAGHGQARHLHRVFHHAMNYAAVGPVSQGAL